MFLLPLLMSFPLLLSAQIIEPARQEAQPSSAARDQCPFTVLDSSVCRFGVIPQGAIVNHEFRIKNTGNTPLLIRSVDNGCGCAVADWPKAPIAPGKTAIIKTTFNSVGKEGPTRQVFAIRVDQYDKVVEVVLTGSVSAPPKTFPYIDYPQKDDPH